MNLVKYKTKVENLETELVGLNLQAENLLLVVHGWNVTGIESWQKFISKLGLKLDNWAVLGVSLPGFGGSDLPDKLWGVEEYASWLKAFCTQSLILEFVENLAEIDNQTKLNSAEFDLGLNSINFKFKNYQTRALLGHSFGGGISALLVARQPLLFQKLILAAPAIIRNPESKSLSTITKITKTAKALLKQLLPQKLFKLVKKLWYKIINTPDYGKTEGLKSEIMGKIIRQDLQNYLPEIKIPTSIFWGTQDKYTPYLQAKLIQGQIKGSKLITFENINHGLHLNSLGKIVTETEQFLEKN